MRCAACKARLSGDGVSRCACGATFCTEVTRTEHQDPRTQQWVRQQFRCIDLHHCTKRMNVAIDALEQAHGRMRRPA